MKNHASMVGNSPAEKYVYYKLHVEHVHKAVSIDVGAANDPRICFGTQENVHAKLNVQDINRAIEV
ncbi:MAG: hypothetical protein QGM45_09385 [Anaerolineales bacterium]|nr:hypothetical protein [Anaerolineales bacterium]